MWRAWDEFVAIYRPLVHRLAMRQGLQAAGNEVHRRWIVAATHRSRRTARTLRSPAHRHACGYRAGRGARSRLDPSQCEAIEHLVGRRSRSSLLTDFGLARATDDASLTRSGFHPGTPHYMSPEQVRGEAIDARSDLFGLGCVIYAMCTGHPPFRSETSYAVLRRITDDTPRPIRETNASIPQWLDRIVMKLLAKSREDRYSSADEVHTLLERCLAHVQQPTAVELPLELQVKAKSRQWFAALAMVPVCIAVMCGAWWFKEWPVEFNDNVSVPQSENFIGRLCHAMGRRCE